MQDIYHADVDYIVPSNLCIDLNGADIVLKREVLGSDVRYVVAITGASGAIYGIRLLQELEGEKILVISRTAREIIPAEKATFDDFKACIYLANTQFRGAKYIFKSLKNQWFDEELTKGIRKMETLYIPFFITVLGFCVILGLGYGRLEGAVSWILALCGWLLADIFLVSPLLYFAVVPKPVRKHIKDVHNLTPYEQKIYEKEQNTNLRVERTLKKYKNTGKIRYDKDGNGYMED